MSNSTEILLVEDDPGDAHLVLAVFRALQIADRCSVASDGEEALDFLLERGRFAGRSPGLPSLILLDLKMPRVDGFDFLERMKADHRFRLIPVVALTSSREERDVERAYDLGVNGYVVKGIDYSDYRATLQALASYWVGVNERPPQFIERSRSAPAGTPRVRLRSAPDNPWLWPLCPA